MGKTAGFLFFGGVVEFIILHCGFAGGALFVFFQILSDGKVLRV